jgi:hypothetical protein
MRYIYPYLMRKMHIYINISSNTIRGNRISCLPGIYRRDLTHGLCYIYHIILGSYYMLNNSGYIVSNLSFCLKNNLFIIIKINPDYLMGNHMLGS